MPNGMGSSPTTATDGARESLPTDEQVDHALGAYGPPLRSIDYAGHIPDAPGQHGAERGYGITADQIAQQRAAIGDGWSSTATERPAAWAAFGDGPDGAA